VTGYFSNLLRYTRASGPRRGAVQTSLPKQSSDPTRIVEQHERVLVDGDRSTEQRNVPDTTRGDLPARDEMARNSESPPERSSEFRPAPELPVESSERDQPAVIEDPSVSSDPASFEVKEEVEAPLVQDQVPQPKREAKAQQVSIERLEQKRTDVIAQPGQISEGLLQVVDPPPERAAPHELHATVEVRPSESIQGPLSKAEPANAFRTEESSSSEREVKKEERPPQESIEDVHEVDERQVIWKQVYQDVRAWAADSPAVETVLEGPYGETEDIRIVERIVPQSDQARTQPSTSESHPMTQRIETQELELSIGSINVTIEAPEARMNRPVTQAGNSDRGEPPSSLSRYYLRLR